MGDAMNLGDMQRKLERQQFQAARLQRAHNRTLTRLRKTSKDLASLKRLIEENFLVEELIEEDSLPMYEDWCKSVGTLTPAERAARVAQQCNALDRSAVYDITDAGRSAKDWSSWAWAST